MPLALPVRPPRRLRCAVAAVALATAACAATQALAQAPSVQPPADAASAPPAVAPPPHTPRSRQAFNTPGPEQVARRVQTMDEELQLTPDQRTKVTAVYQDEANRMIAINTKYAGTDGATTQRRAKLSEMRAVNQDTQDKLAKLLTAKQATQWNEFVQERRERNRKTLRHDVPHPAAPGGTLPGGAPATGAAK